MLINPYRQFLMEVSKDLIAMIHVQPLPGTPLNTLSPTEIIDQALKQAELYKKCGIQTVMIENMHDVPYTKSVGPEIPSLMGIIGHEIRKLGLFCGIQILAGCNEEALAASYCAGLDFIRAEGYVFGHVGDEGYIDSCAGNLLRYRKKIGADNVLVFTDIKKKHSSHSITSDVSIAETAHAAEFFLTDGLIVTGSSTGKQAELDDLKAIQHSSVLKLVGSGITPENLPVYYPWTDIFIVGSYLKKDGNWKNAPDENRINSLLEVFQSL